MKKDLPKRIRQTFIRSIKKTLSTLLFVVKIVIPAALAVLIIKNTILIEYISSFSEPLMTYFGLSGEASLPLFLGMLSGTGESVGAIIALGLPVRQITIIGVMVGLCNSIIAETLIFKNITPHYWKTAIIRLLFSISAGFILNKVI